MSEARQSFDAALGSWLARQAAAEERLTSFAFREGQPPVPLPAPSSHDELRRWILDTVAARDVAAFLRAVPGPGRTMTDLADQGAFDLRPGDRVALAARIGVLAASGLVARDLEADQVGLTELGRAALILAEESASDLLAEGSAPIAIAGGPA